MKKTGDLRPLDLVESMFKRVAFRIPEARGDLLPLVSMLADSTREFGEQMQAMAAAMTDGKITAPEAEKCLKETRDTIAALIKLEAYLKQYLTAGAGPQQRRTFARYKEAM